MAPTTNPLLATSKSPDSTLRALLHPLVLLTISDYITRHTLRSQLQPIAGALLGHQNGREVSLEHAFEIRLVPNNDNAATNDGMQWTLDDNWFQERLQQYKDVHKNPPLEFVGWWTLCPSSGPEPNIRMLQEKFVAGYNESALLLAFHPSSIFDRTAVGGKLPLTIYESMYEAVAGNNEEQGKEMHVYGEEGLELRFQELSYEVVTGEAEMISVDFVARGGGNAAEVDSTVKKSEQVGAKTPLGEKSNLNGKGKEKVVETTVQAKTEDLSGLTTEDEELIASLTTRANAIKMLHSRIRLLHSYLSSLPPSYLTTSAAPALTATILPDTNSSQAVSPTQLSELSHTLLRSILALTTRLPLLIPANSLSYTQASQAEKSDVSLVALLGSLGKSIQDAKSLGRTFAVVEGAKSGRKGAAGGSGAMEDMGMGMSLGTGIGMMGGNGDERGYEGE